MSLLLHNGSRDLLNHLSISLTSAAHNAVKVGDKGENAVLAGGGPPLSTLAGTSLCYAALPVPVVSELCWRWDLSGNCACVKCYELLNWAELSRFCPFYGGWARKKVSLLLD